MILNVAAYHFVAIADPDVLVEHCRERAEAACLRGTVLIAGEGINLVLAGDEVPLRVFVDDLLADSRFAAMRPKYSVSETNPFARLKVKIKPEIISFRQDDSDPLAGDRAPAIAPIDLARWITQGHDDAGRRLVLLDTRNREEVRHGTFTGALSLDMDRFTDLPKAIEPHLPALADAAVVSFCTGGVRCEKAALWLIEQGVENVWQLDEGILGYFAQVGDFGYEGDCFVFDQRVALRPDLSPVKP
ncbi:MAG: sulfurtransferase [Dokdonella sp.]